MPKKPTHHSPYYAFRDVMGGRFRYDKNVLSNTHIYLETKNVKLIRLIQKSTENIPFHCHEVSLYDLWYLITILDLRIVEKLKE